MGVGGPGRAGNPEFDVNRRAGLPKFATAKELERYNAAEALFNETRKLKLTEAQMTSLGTLRANFYEQNARVLIRYDSVRRNFRVPPALDATKQNAASSAPPPTQEEMQVLSEQMRAMMTIADELMANRPAQIILCLNALDEGQRDQARKVMDDQTKDLRKQVPPLPPMPQQRGQKKP